MADTDGTSSSPPAVGEPEAGSGTGSREAQDAQSASAAPSTAQFTSPEASDDDPVTAKTQPRKRASALAKTLQTGAGLQETWRADPAASLPAATPSEDSGIQPLSSAEPASSAPSQGTHESSPAARDGHVLDAAALADTQQDPRQRALQRAARNGKLSRTLRMEIKLGSGSPEVKPLGATDTTDPGSSASPSLFKRAAPNSDSQSLMFGSTQRVGTDGNQFASGRSFNATNPMGVPSPRDPRTEPFGSVSGGTFSGNGFAPKFSSAPPPPLPQPQRKRELRPGERTMVLTRRNVFVKDWLFVVLLVTALGVTASMLVSYRNQPTPEDADDTAQHALTEGDPAQDEALNAPQPGAVRATELRSEPSGAEVIVSGAVVGNTPVRVAREATDMEYTLRLNGYESQLVRVGANSPAAIKVTLQPKAATR